MIKAVVFDWMGTLYDHASGLYPGSVNVLEYLKPKYKLGLVTLAVNGIKLRKKSLEEQGVLKYFDSVVIDIEKGREQYLTCIKQMEVVPTVTAVVDDQIGRILIAKELGCETYWVTSDSTTLESGIIKIASVEMLRDIL